MTDSVSGDHRYYGEDSLPLSNSSTITDLTVTITVARTTGVTNSGQYTNFPAVVVA